MPITSDKRYYPAARTLTAAGITPTLKSATANQAQFDVEDAKEFNATLNVHEHYTTALAGANNDLTFIARTPGTAPTITVTYVDPSANNAALSVSVSGSDITVNLATNGSGTITSTASQVKAAIEASAAATALVVVELAASNTGAGVVTALAQQTLAGPVGTNPTLDVKLQGTTDNTNYFDIATFTQQTAAGTIGKLFASLSQKLRWVVTIGGTDSPAFAMSITVQHRP